jgi:hypothetical protein
MERAELVEQIATTEAIKKLTPITAEDLHYRYRARLTEAG